MSALSLGIYFGSKGISVVATRAKKLLKSFQIPQSAISAADFEEKVPLEIKIAEITSLLKDGLRKNEIESKEASICLSGRELIVRTFEIPMLPRHEMQSAVNFEARRHIPFKIEELVCAHQVRFEKTSNTNTVLFMGIKKEVLDKYLSMLNHLGIKVSAIEYSAFSLLRCLKLTGAASKGVIGLLEVDIEAENEANFTVSENGFPLFSRDISLEGSGLGQEAAEAKSAQLDEVLEKLKKEVRVSLDYYDNKFPAKNIKKIFFLANADYRANLESVISELGVSISFIDVSKFIGPQQAALFSLNKSYCSSLSSIIKSNLKVDLLAVKEKAAAAKERVIQKEAVAFSLSSVLKDLKLDPRALAIGLSICGLAFGLGLYKTKALRNELNAVIAERPATISVEPALDNKELSRLESEYKNKLGVFENLVRQQVYVTDLLNIIPMSMSEGLWLTGISFKKEQNKIELSLEGTVYLADAVKEFEAANKFLLNLKQNRDLVKYFKNTSLNFLDRRTGENKTVTVFSISCKN